MTVRDDLVGDAPTPGVAAGFGLVVDEFTSARAALVQGIELPPRHREAGAVAPACQG